MPTESRWRPSKLQMEQSSREVNPAGVRVRRPDPPYHWVSEREAKIIYVRALRTLTAEDAFTAMERQIASGLWRHGLLYDLQLTHQATSISDSEKIA